MLLTVEFSLLRGAHEFHFRLKTEHSTKGYQWKVLNVVMNLRRREHLYISAER